MHRTALRGREGGAWITAGQACREPQGEIGADLRCVGKLVARPIACDLGQVAAGPSHSIRPHPYGAAPHVSRQPYPGVGEQYRNTAERAMRSVAVGRKNYQFVGSQTGGNAAAIAYTLIETAKLNGVNPQAWLADTLWPASPTTRSPRSAICSRGGCTDSGQAGRLPIAAIPDRNIYPNPSIPQRPRHRPCGSLVKTPP